MTSNAFFEILKQAEAQAAPGAAHAGAGGRPQRAGGQGRWRVLPLEGTFEIVYEDSRGAWSTRRIEARELKLGPGRTLLGGIDRARGGYRGFRADRIRRLTDPAGATRIEAGILDWLLARAEAQRRAQADQVRALAARMRAARPRRVAA